QRLALVLRRVEEDGIDHVRCFADALEGDGCVHVGRIVRRPTSPSGRALCAWPASPAAPSPGFAGYIPINGEEFDLRWQTPPRATPLTEIATEDAPRTKLAWGELNRVLGGGIVPGSLVLIGGEPGVGKSTLLMHAAAQIARGGKVLYVSGEESGQQVLMRARRLGALEPGILLLAENDLDAICETIRAERPRLAIIDSIQ